MIIIKIYNHELKIMKSGIRGSGAGVFNPNSGRPVLCRGLRNDSRALF